MGNPDKERFPGRESRAHDPSTKDRVVCEDRYVRIGTRGADRDALGRTPARDISKNAVCETLASTTSREAECEASLRESVEETRPRFRGGCETVGLAWWVVGAILRHAYFRNTVRDNEDGRTSIRPENRIKGLLDEGGGILRFVDACDSLAVRKTRSLKVRSMRITDRRYISGPVFKGKLCAGDILFL